MLANLDSEGMSRRGVGQKSPSSRKFIKGEAQRSRPFNHAYFYHKSLTFRVVSE